MTQLIIMHNYDMETRCLLTGKKPLGAVQSLSTHAVHMPCTVHHRARVFARDRASIHQT